MTEILEHYQQYVPCTPCKKNIPQTCFIQDLKFITTLVGGDYLSVARTRGTQLIRSSHSLGGMLPVAEDWHAKVCFWKGGGGRGARHLELNHTHIYYIKLLSNHHSIIIADKFQLLIHFDTNDGLVAPFLIQSGFYNA